MKKQNNIYLWVFIFLLSIIFTGLTIYFTYKKIDYEKNKVETYIIYNYDYAYYYNNKEWLKVTDMSFINDKEYMVFNGYNFLGNLPAILNDIYRKIIYNDGKLAYANLIGINSNKKIPFLSYNFETINNDKIEYVKSYLKNKNQIYFEGFTEVEIIKINIDADVVLENLYMISYIGNNSTYYYFVIQDGNDTETLISYVNRETDMNFKRYRLGLIIDADLNEQKEILIIEDGYEYSKLLLYANQYGTYSLVE